MGGGAGQGGQEGLYLLLHAHPDAERRALTEGATHTAEISYAFNNPKGQANQTWNDVDTKLADTMSSYWVNFITKGDPNGNGLPRWPEYKDLLSGQVMVLGDTVQAESAVPAPKLSFYQAAFQRLLRTPAGRTSSRVRVRHSRCAAPDLALPDTLPAHLCREARRRSSSSPHSIQAPWDERYPGRCEDTSGRSDSAHGILRVEAHELIMARLMAELRIALRSLGRTPRLFVCAVACLAVAIGTATAVFAIVNAVVLRPLPFQHATRLVAIWGVNPARDTVKRGFSWPDTIDLSRATRSLDGVAALANAPAGMTLTGRGDPAQIPMWVVSGNFFQVLGVPAALGRTLGVEHDVPRSQPAVTISHALWQERFGSDPSIVGQTLTLDGRPFIVTGVAPRGFAYPPGAQMWVTIAHGVPEYVDNRGVGWLEIIGRMKPGTTPEGARADLAIPLDDLTKRYHASRGREDVSVVPLQRELLGDTRPALWAVLAAVLVLLAVACANVGGLLLVRSAARSHDLAVRLALGATRRHVVSEALAESATLLAISSVLGIVLATVLIRAGPAGRAWQHPRHRGRDHRLVGARLRSDRYGRVDRAVRHRARCCSRSRETCCRCFSRVADRSSVRADARGGRSPASRSPSRCCSWSPRRS